MSKRDDPADYWRDPDHDYLRFSLLDAAGQVIREVGQWRVEAPINKNTQATLTMQIEVLHADDCGRVIQRISIGPY